MAEPISPSNEPTTGGKTPSQTGLYAQLAARAPQVIEKLFALLGSNNEAIALGAAKVIANKIIPDKKAIELTGDNGEPIRLNIISGADYVSTTGNPLTASTASPLLGSAQTQSTGLASPGPQNHNSNQPDSEVESA